MALPFDVWDSLDLSFDDFEYLDLEWDDIDSLPREDLMRKVIRTKLIGEQKDPTFWDNLSTVVDYNNRYSEHQIVEAHKKIEQLQSEATELAVKAEHHKTQCEDIKQQLSVEKDARIKAEGLNKILSIITIIGIIPIMKSFIEWLIKILS